MSPRIAGSLLCAAATTAVGSSISVTTAMQDYPVFGGQAIRYLATALILAAVLRIRGVGWIRASLVDLLRLLALAGSGMVGFNLALIPATKYANPSLIGAILGCAPLIMAIAGPLIQRQRPRLGVIGCAVVVMIGIVIIEGVDQGSVLGTVLAVCVLLCELGFSLLAIPLLPRYGPLRVGCYASALSAGTLLVLGLIMPEPLLRVPTATEALALMIMGLLLTPGAFAVWYSGLQRIGAASAGLWLGLVPISATVTSVLLGWEPLTPGAAIGTLLIAIGITASLLPRVVRVSGRYDDLKL